MEVPQICNRARDAVEAMLELNVSQTPPTIGQVRTEAVKASQRARMETMLSKYWDADADGGYYSGADNVRDAYETYLNEPVRACFFEIEMNLSDRSIEVRQNGTDYAVVSFELENLAARYRGDGETIFVGECYGSEGGDSDALGEYVGSYYGYVEMEMHRKDGEWRVCGIYTTLYMTNKTPAQTETGGNE